MAATTTQTIRLTDCPACGERIVLTANYDVHLGGIESSVNAKVSKATATLTMTGARVNHQCNRQGAATRATNEEVER